jgi:hypothetical protein
VTRGFADESEQAGTRTAAGRTTGLMPYARRTVVRLLIDHNISDRY